MPITISINSGKDYEPVSEGVHSAVLADIVDLGNVQTDFGEKHKIQFVYLTDEADEGGRTKYLFERFTASLHEKASLRKRVKGILGRDLNASEKNFDVETLIGLPVKAMVAHSESNDGKIYANIVSLKPDPKGTVTIPADFQRKQDRPSDGKTVAKAILKPAPAGYTTLTPPTPAKAVPAARAITNEVIPF